MSNNLHHHNVLVMQPMELHSEITLNICWTREIFRTQFEFKEVHFAYSGKSWANGFWWIIYHSAWANFSQQIQRHTSFYSGKTQNIASEQSFMKQWMGNFSWYVSLIIYRDWSVYKITINRYWNFLEQLMLKFNHMY